jgi:hypothetical protein
MSYDYNVEFCDSTRNLRVTPKFVRHIKSALQWVPPEDLIGIEKIYLMDYIPKITPGANVAIENGLKAGLLLFAAYNARNDVQSASVTLFVHNLFKPIPRMFRGSPAFTLWLAESIGHEVGHHLLAEKRFIPRLRAAGNNLESKEEFADRYSRDIVNKMKLKTRYRMGAWLLEVAAELNYLRGLRSLRRKDFDSAVKQFYLATQVEPNHVEASRGFWQSLRKLNRENVFPIES